MTVLIIGGSGFIGSELARQLASKDSKFTIADIRPSREYPGKYLFADVTSADSLDAINANTVETIVLLAAEHRDNVQPRSRYALVNVEGARNVSLFAEKKGIKRIVFTSSVAVYGFAAPQTSEAGAIQPFNDYGRTKAQAENVLQDWQARDPDHRALAIIRPTVVFGPGNRGNVHNLIDQIARGRFVMVGSGLNRKSMAYIENVAAFLAFSLNCGPGVHLYNYVDKPDFDMNSFVGRVNSFLRRKQMVGLRLPICLGMALGYAADALAKISGRSLPLRAIRVRKFISETSFASAAHNIPGFSAPVQLDDGLSRTIDADFLNPRLNRNMRYAK